MAEPQLAQLVLSGLFAAPHLGQGTVWPAATALMKLALLFASMIRTSLN
jgi:hypothetical protein